MRVDRRSREFTVTAHFPYHSSVSVSEMFLIWNPSEHSQITIWHKFSTCSSNCSDNFRCLFWSRNWIDKIGVESRRVTYRLRRALAGRFGFGPLCYRALTITLCLELRKEPMIEVQPTFRIESNATRSRGNKHRGHESYFFIIFIARCALREDN